MPHCTTSYACDSTSASSLSLLHFAHQPSLRKHVKIRSKKMSVQTQSAPAGEDQREQARWQVTFHSYCTYQASDLAFRKYLDHIRRTPGPFTDPDATSEEFLALFENFQIL